MKRIILFVLCITLSYSIAFANVSGVTATVRFYDKKIYYQGDEIWIEVVITNESGSTYRFKVADRRVYSFDFEVMTPTYVQLDHSREFTIQRTSDQPVFFREVSLEPGEKYGVLLELGDFVSFSEPGVFVVRGMFYPELYRGTTPLMVSSNALTLNLRPAAATLALQARIDAETGLLLEREALPPDEVVAYTIRARQKSQWNRFFLYLDLESLLRQNPEREEAYIRSSEEVRMRMLEEYKAALEQETVDQEILLIPATFDILKTSYTPDEGQVVVRQTYAHTGYTEVKKYTYFLTRSDQVWLITSYDVQNLGTQ